MLSYITALDWIKNYRREWLSGDLSAGLTVGVMLIPQGMAYALLAGLPAVYGLYASTFPLIIYALLGSSRQLAVGPVAMVSLLTAAGVGTLATAGTEAYLALALTLALLVGLIQFALGALRLGFLVTFLSHPVISGFTSAAALIIGLSQLKHLLGINLPNSHHVHEILLAAAGNIDQINWLTAAIGIGAMLVIIAVRRQFPAIPGALVAVVLGISITAAFSLNELGVKIVGNVPKGLPQFQFSGFSWADLRSLLPISLAISLVSFMESIAVAKAMHNRHRDYQLNANQELFALGMANIVGSFLQSFPVTGGFSRTAVNDQAGAKTGLASLIAAALVLLTLLFFTPLFYYLPNAVLAAVIIVAVINLIDWREAVNLWHIHRVDFWMLIATFFFTLLLGIEQGIGIGVVLSLASVVYGSARPHLAVLGKLPDAPYYLNIERHEKLEIRRDILVLRFDAPLFFANTDFFRENIEQLAAAKGDALKAIIVQCDTISQIDSTAMHMLEQTIEDFRKRDIQLLLAAVIGPVRDRLADSGLRDKIGKDHFFLSVQQAVDSLDGKYRFLTVDQMQTYTMQRDQ